MEDMSEDLFMRYKEKKEDLYVKVEKELKEIREDIRSVHAVPTTPSSSETTELGDELD